MSGAVDHAGWAFKQGSKVKNWKKRYFVLRGRELSYFGSQNIYGRGEDEKGRVTVVGIESLQADAKSCEELLLITCERKSHLLKIKPLNTEDARAWMAKIQIAVAPNQLHDEYRTDTTVNATNLFGTDIHDEQDDCDGDGIAYAPPSAPTESVQAYYKVAPSTSAFAQPIITNNTNNTNNGNNTNANDSNTNTWNPSHRLLAESSLAMDTEDNQYESDQDATNNLLQQHESSRTLARGSLAKGNHIGVTCEGWVIVGDPQDQRSWKKRYGVLAGPSFTYFASKGSDQALDTVWIEGVALSRVRPNALDVKLESGRVLGLAVDSREELIEWERGIAAVLGTSVLLRSVSSRDDALLDGGSGHDLQSDPVGGRPSSYTGVFREGWLLLKHGFGKTEWKRRYFVLNGATLQERESATSRHNVSESFVVHMDVQNDSEMEVELMSGRTLWLRAENAADTEAWIHALSDLVGTPTASGAGLTTLSPVSTPVIRPLIQNVAPFQPTRGYEEDLDGNGGDEEDDGDDDSTGYGTWDDAMRNRPSLDRESSWESDTSETTPPKDDPAAVGYDSDGSKATPVLTQERRGHAGWLKKEGGNIKNWKRRYFTLHGTTLKYFKSVSSSSPLRSLEVTQVEELPSTKFGFAVTTTKGRRLVVTAESQDQYEKWLVVLWGVLADQRASLTAMSSSSSPTATGRVSGSAGSTASVSGVKSGWLEKEGQVFKTWKKRYFTLANGALVYYTDIGGDPQGHGAVHGVIVDKTKSNTLRILMGKDRVMRVTAASAAETTAWFQALSTSLSKASDDGGLSEASSGSSPSSAARSMGGSSPLNQQQQQTRGQRQETRASRFDADDYLKNDTITNESFVRIRGAGDELSLTNGSFYKPRSFKGELTLSVPNEPSSSTDPVALVRIDSDGDDDLEYLRGSNVAEKHKMEALRRKKQQEEDDGHVLLLPTQCAPCCSIQ